MDFAAFHAHASHVGRERWRLLVRYSRINRGCTISPICISAHCKLSGFCTNDAGYGAACSCLSLKRALRRRSFGGLTQKLWGTRTEVGAPNRKCRRIRVNDVGKRRPREECRSWPPPDSRLGISEGRFRGRSRLMTRQLSYVDDHGKVVKSSAGYMWREAGPRYHDTYSRQVFTNKSWRESRTSSPRLMRRFRDGAEATGVTVRQASYQDGPDPIVIHSPMLTRLFSVLTDTQSSG